MKKDDGWKKGSVDIWDAMWTGRDATYSIDKIENQTQLFDKIKFEALEKIFPDSRNVKSLECGCGSAGASVYFREKRGYRTAMLDMSDHALDVAKKNFKKQKLTGGRFIKGDVEDMPFEDDKFDIVMSFGLLEHFKDIQPAVSEMMRVLKPGGIFFSDLCPKRFSVQSIADILNSLSRLLYFSGKGQFKKAFSSISRKPGFYENRLSLLQYKEIFEEEGLANVRITGNRPYPTLLLLLRLEQIYIQSLQKKPFIRFWKWFDNSDTAFSDILGAGWWAYGKKRMYSDNINKIIDENEQKK